MKRNNWFLAALLSLSLAFPLVARNLGQTGGAVLNLPKLRIKVPAPPGDIQWTPMVNTMTINGKNVELDFIVRTKPEKPLLAVGLVQFGTVKDCAVLLNGMSGKNNKRVDRPPYLPASWTPMAIEAVQASGATQAYACLLSNTGAILATIYSEAKLSGPDTQSLASLLDGVASAMRGPAPASKVSESPQPASGPSVGQQVTLAKTGLRVVLPYGSEEWAVKNDENLDYLTRTKPANPELSLGLTPGPGKFRCEKLLPIYQEKLPGANLVNNPAYLPASWPPLSVEYVENGDPVATVCHATSAGPVILTLRYAGGLSSPEAHNALAPILDALAKAADAK
jgi:hypothetical protein